MCLRYDIINGSINQEVVQGYTLSKQKKDASSYPTDKLARNAGFTLIELSIVLVIIGLIVGGMLVGQELISAAEVRATISQLEKYNAAVNTFYGKFQAMPGDINNTAAARFGFSNAAHNGTGAPGQGDGNGLLDSNGGPSVGTVGGVTNQTFSFPSVTGETGVFWVDLSSAAAGTLIDGTFTSATEATSIFVSTTTVPLYLPLAKINRGNYIYAFELNGQNYFGIMNFLMADPEIRGNGSMTVAQAYSIDTKIDDGFPTTGRVAAMINNGGFFWVTGGSPGISTYVPSGSLFSGVVGTAGDASSATTCFDAASGTTPIYSMKQNNGAGTNCALIIRFQ